MPGIQPEDRVGRLKYEAIPVTNHDEGALDEQHSVGPDGKPYSLAYGNELGQTSYERTCEIEVEGREEDPNKDLYPASTEGHTLRRK